MKESNIPNPWVLKSKKVIYDNPWISVEHHEVMTPNNTEGIYGKVHFKNIAVAVIPIDNEGNTWIVGQYRYTLDAYSWELPMGGGDLSRDPVLSAQMELREETGLSALSWECIMELHTSNSVTDERAYVYIAKDLSIGDTEWDHTEDLVIRKVPIQEVYCMVMDQEITDAISVAGLLKYKMMQEVKNSK